MNTIKNVSPIATKAASTPSVAATNNTVRIGRSNSTHWGLRVWMSVSWLIEISIAVPTRRLYATRTWTFHLVAKVEAESFPGLLTWMRRASSYRWDELQLVAGPLWFLELVARCASASFCVVVHLAARIRPRAGCSRVTLPG